MALKSACDSKPRPWAEEATCQWPSVSQQNVFHWRSLVACIASTTTTTTTHLRGQAAHSNHAVRQAGALQGRGAAHQRRVEGIGLHSKHGRSKLVVGHTSMQ